MTNKEIVKRLHELDYYINQQEYLCKKFPKSENYNATLRLLQVQKADLAEQLYKEKQ